MNRERSEQSFVNGLKRLFSSDAIVRHVNNGKGLKVVDTDGRKFQQALKRDNYKRFYQKKYITDAGTAGSSFQYQRTELFKDYEAMEKDPIISSALDIYADESTTENEAGDLLVIKSDNNDIKEILENLFYDILNIEFNLWS